MSYRRKHIHPKIRGLRKKKSIFKIPIFWFCVLGGMVFLGILWTIVFLPKIQVAHITISGNEKVTSNQIEKVIWDDISRPWFLGFSSKSIFFVNTQTLAKDLQQKFSDIEMVQVQKKIFDGITVAVKERVPFALFCGQNTPQDCFFIDEWGVVFSPQVNMVEGMMIVKNPTGGDAIVAGQQVADKDDMATIVKIQKMLKSDAGLDIVELENANPLVVVTSEGWSIYFNPHADIDLQLTKLGTLLKDQITLATRKNLQYIYLQYNDRVYYK